MLELYLHPLAAYCWKVLLALYETDTPFTPVVIDLGNADDRARLAAVWPFARFPVLRDHAREVTVPESSIIIEHLARHVPAMAKLVPADSLTIRARDRLFDLWIQEPLGRIVRHLLRPGDPAIVHEAAATLRAAYRVVEDFADELAQDTLTLADCAAAPALFYADHLVAIDQPRTRACLERLLARPSMIRVRAEAQPYWHNFPGKDRPQIP